MRATGLPALGWQCRPEASYLTWVQREPTCAALFSAQCCRLASTTRYCSSSCMPASCGNGSARTMPPGKEIPRPSHMRRRQLSGAKNAELQRPGHLKSSATEVTEAFRRLRGCLLAAQVWCDGNIYAARCGKLLVC